MVTKNKNINSLVVDSLDDSYWLASGSVIFHLSRDRQLIRTYDVAVNDEHSSAISLYCDSKGRLWLAADHKLGLRIYNRKKDTFEPCQWGLEWSPIIVEEDKQNGCFWIGTRFGGIVRYEIPENTHPTKGIITQQPATLPMSGTDNQGTDDSGRGFVYGICLSDNKLWVSTIDNLYCY